ncbi:MAG: hypothetical protein H7Y59_14440 [Anaerolineales bacterium]|nr:hypothetical protein [Anaerolineales bacterium]
MTININIIKKKNTGRINCLGANALKAITNASKVIINAKKTMTGRGMAIFGKSRFDSPIYLVELMANIVRMVINIPGQFFCKARISGGDVNAHEAATKIMVKVGSQKVTL